MRDIRPGDLIFHKHELGHELRLVINISRRQEKNRSLWGLGWIVVGSPCLTYKYGWFWSDSQHIVLNKGREDEIL